MPASVDIVRWTGGAAGTIAGAHKNVITGGLTRANAYDGHSGSGSEFPAVDTASPVQIPTGSNVNCSFWVTTQLFYNSSLSSTISNVRWFSTGANNFGGGTPTTSWSGGIDCVGNKATSYMPCTHALNALNVVGTSGAPLTMGNHPYLVSPGAIEVWPWVESSPLTLDAGNVVTGGSSAGTNVGIGSYFVYQIQVGSSAVAGQSTAQTFTFKYDET